MITLKILPEQCYRFNYDKVNQKSLRFRIIVDQLKRDITFDYDYSISITYAWLKASMINQYLGNGKNQKSHDFCKSIQ